MLIRVVRSNVTRDSYRRLLKMMQLVGLSLMIATSASAQKPNTVSGAFRAYNTAAARISPGQAASNLRVELQRRGLSAEVVADSPGKRVFVSGSPDAQSFAAQYMRSLLKPAATDAITEDNATKLQAYPLPQGDLSSTITSMRQKFGSQPGVRIGMDQRTRQILVHAPSDVQSEVRSWLMQHVAKTRRDAKPNRNAPKPKSSLAWSGDGSRLAQSQLKHISWQQLVRAVERMTPNRLTLTQANDSHDLLVTLPARKGQTELRITPASGSFKLRGDDALVRGWLQAIASLDQPKRSDVEATQLMPVSNVKPETITRAARLLQAARRGDSSQVRWGGDVVGIKTNDPEAKTQSEFVELREAKTTQVAQVDNAQPNQAAGDDQVEVQVPNEAAAGGALIGPVQIDFVEGLDSIIIRGSKPDVDRVIRIIEDIERLSLITEPKIELVPLEHVNSTSMAELVTQVNTTALAARRGTVSITALVKPNSLLLIGRPESVDATIKLIKDLDQPVAPTSQFKIFRLKYMSATDAQLTIDNFFAERTGLGPIIQIQADFRSNALIVYASPRDMAEVEQLIQRIDVGDSEAVDEVRVFKLKNALAEELGPVLEATLRGDTSQTRGGLGGQQGQFPGAIPQQAQQLGGTGQNQALRGMASPRSTMLRLTLDAEGNKVLKSGILTNVRVAADVRANSLVVTAPPDSMSLIAALVEQLDELPTSEAKIKVFTILNGDAPSLAEMLSNLFGEADQQDGPALQSATGAGESSLVPLRFSVDLRTNSIIATGADADLFVVESILLRLDADDVSQRRSRVYRLQNAPALDVATAINEFLRVEREIQQVAPEQISPFEQIEREVVVVPEVVSNSLIISSTPRFFDAIEEIVKELDEQPPMVLIQVLIAEVDLGFEEEVGVELGVQDSLLFDRSVAITQANGGEIVNPGFNFNNFPLGSGSSATSLATREKTAGQALTSFALSRTNDMLGYGGLVLSASSESVNLLVRALRENRRLDILSRPQVMTLNNQPAFVLVGQRVPYIQGVQVLNSGQTITPTEFENVGLVLGVTPRISPDGLVVMEIDAEKSELADESEGVPISVNEFGDVIRQPPIDTTVAQTTVSARSGQTVILGGLITKDRQSVSRRVPYLADIPLLGDLFRYDSEAELRTELLIIMTPHIVRKTEDSDLLNQIESERMSWCLADVIDVHGETQLSSGGINRRSLTQLIYPDLDPTGTGSQILKSIEEVPAPELRPAEPPQVNPPRSSDKSGRRLTKRVSQWLSPKSKSSKDAPAAQSRFRHVTAQEDQQVDENTEATITEEYLFDDSEPIEPPTPDDVAPASFVPDDQTKQESTWTKLRKKLKFGR